MRSLALFFLVVLAVTCGPSPDAKLPGYVGSNGGSVAPSRGGSTETGGATGNGGAVSTGGSTVVALGGTTGTGGSVASGGTKAAGGSVASGGAVGVGGVGGSTSAGGATGAGGAMLPDASLPPAGDGGNCISKIVNNGYACGTTVPACSACKDNATSLEAKCKAMLDCYEMNYPCTGNCQLECLNKAGASSPVRTCVDALQAAACTGAGSC